MNYTDFRITKLLPPNPYNNNKRERHPFFFVECGVDFSAYCNETPTQIIKKYYNKSSVLYFGWTWEEIRLYLASKCWFIPTINKCYFSDRSKYFYICEYLYANSEGYDCINSEDSNLYFDTYEEAREHAIIYLLTHKVVL